MQERFGIPKVLLTPSCTAALEMAAQLCDIGPGDEVIMPSYTFVSTASAFVRMGGRPIFVDIRPDTLNIDETLIEAAITEHTKAICVVHYAGVSCEMDTIMQIARRHGLRVVEDAAQGVNSWYTGRALGSIGDLGCYSFHETRNYICGEGGHFASTTQNFCNEPKSSVTRARIGNDSSAVKSTNTPGSMSAHPTSQARSAAHSCTANWKRWTASQNGATKSTFDTSRLCTQGSTQASFDFHLSPKNASATTTCSISCYEQPPSGIGY